MPNYYKQKTNKSHALSSDNLNLILCWSTFGSIVSLKSFLIYSASLAVLSLDGFSHSSLHYTSSYIRLDGRNLQTVIFRSLQRCSTRFKSILWLFYSRTDNNWFWSCSSVTFGLSCLKMNYCPNLRSNVLLRRLRCPGCLCPLLLSSFNLSWLVCWFMLQKSIPIAGNSSTMHRWKYRGKVMCIAYFAPNRLPGIYIKKYFFVSSD